MVDYEACSWKLLSSSKNHLCFIVHTSRRCCHTNVRISIFSEESIIANRFLPLGRRNTHNITHSKNIMSSHWNPRWSAAAWRNQYIENSDDRWSVRNWRLLFNTYPPRRPHLELCVLVPSDVIQTTSFPIALVVFRCRDVRKTAPTDELQFDADIIFRPY